MSLIDSRWGQEMFDRWDMEQRQRDQELLAQRPDDVMDPDYYDWRLPRLGVDEIGSLAEYELKEHPGYESIQKGWLPRVLDAIDLPRNLIAQGIANVIGMDTSAMDMDTILGKKVYTSDILSKGLGMDDNWVTKALGFVGDVAIDPTTYLLGGSGKLLRLAPWMAPFKPEAIKTLQAGVTEFIKTGKTASPYAKLFNKSMEWALPKLSSMDDTARAAMISRAEKGADIMLDPAIEKSLIGQITTDIGENLSKFVTMDDEVGDLARRFALEHGEWGTGVLHIPGTTIEKRVLPSFGRDRALYEALAKNDIPKYLELQSHAAAGWKNYDLRGRLWSRISDSIASPMSYVETKIRKALDAPQMNDLEYARTSLRPIRETIVDNLVNKHGIPESEADRLVLAYAEKGLNLNQGDMASKQLDTLAFRKLTSAIPTLKDLPDDVLKRIDYDELIRKTAKEGEVNIAPYFEKDPGYPTSFKLDETQIDKVMEGLKVVDNAKEAATKQGNIFSRDIVYDIIDKYPDLAKDDTFMKEIKELADELARIKKDDLASGVISSSIEDGYVARFGTKAFRDRMKLLAERNPARVMASDGTPMKIGASKSRSTRVMTYIDDNGMPQVAYNPDDETSAMLKSTFGASDHELSTLQINKLAQEGKLESLLGPDFKDKMFLEDSFLSTVLRKRMSDQGNATKDALHQLYEQNGRYIRSKGAETEMDLLKKQHRYYNEVFARNLEPFMNDAEKAFMKSVDDTFPTGDRLDYLMKNSEIGKLDSNVIKEAAEKSIIDGYKSEMISRIGTAGTIEGRMKTVFDEQVKENLMKRGVVNNEQWKQFASREIDFDALVAGKESQAANAIKDAKDSMQNIIRDEGMFKGKKTLSAFDKQGTPPEGWAIPEIAKDDPYLRQLALPEQIVKEVNSAFKRIDSRESMGLLLDAYDWGQNFWKSQALLGVSWPVFNMFGGIAFNIMSGIGASAYMPKRMQHVLSMMTSAKNPEKLRKLMAIESKTGAVYTAEDIMRLAKDQSIVNAKYLDDVSGMFDNPIVSRWLGGEIKDLDPKEAVKYMAALRKLPRTAQGIVDTRGTKPLKYFFRFNEMLDEFNKLTAFTERLRIGDTPTEAANFVSKIHPDYHPSRYTKFEKDYAMRLAPFYKWSKNATYTMVTQIMAKRPWGMALMPKLQNLLQVEHGMPRELFPEWMRDELAVQVGGDKDSGMLLTLGNMTPHQDFFNLFDPVRSAMSMTTPFVKAPFEYALDRDFFTGRKISDYPGDNRLNKIGNIVEKNLRPLKEIEKLTSLMSSGKPSAYVATRVVAGGRAQYLDVDAIRKDVERDTNNQMQEIRRALNDPNVDPKIKPKLAREFMELMAQRARMNLKVPRSAEIILRQWNNDGTMPLPWVNRG